MDKDKLKLVPVEPTEAMLLAMRSVIEKSYNPVNYAQMYKERHAYQHLLDATPSQASAEPMPSDPPYRVAEFWSSSTPGTKVRMLAEGDDIEQWGRRGDFIRWVSNPTATQAASPSESVDSAEFAHLLHEYRKCPNIGQAAILRAEVIAHIHSWHQRAIESHLKGTGK